MWTLNCVVKSTSVSKDQIHPLFYKTYKLILLSFSTKDSCIKTKTSFLPKQVGLLIFSEVSGSNVGFKMAVLRTFPGSRQFLQKNTEDIYQPTPWLSLFTYYRTDYQLVIINSTL